MQVRVKFFGYEPPTDSEKTSDLIEIKGGGFLADLPESATIKDLVEILVKNKSIDEQKLIENATILVNQEKGSPGTTLSNQDSVLVLIPLGGG